MKAVISRIDKFEVLRIVLAFAVAFGISAILVFITSETPVYCLTTFLFAPMEKLKYFSNILEMMIPLTFTGLSLCIVYQSKNFSLIAEGCLYLGAVVASYVAIKMSLPAGWHPATAMVLSALVGGCIGTLPGIIKIKWEANELVTSLMFNYVFYFFGLYIINYFLRDPQASVFASYKFGKTFALPTILPGTRLHAGFLIAIAAVLLVYFYIYKTKWGYELRTVGENIEFAKYSGINTSMVLISSQFIAGALAGVGGAIEMAGMYKRFLWDTTASYAWDGVIIALLAKNNPKYVPFGAFFLSYMRIGADLMSRRGDVDNEIIAIIQAVMILLIAGERFLSYWKLREENKAAKEKYVSSRAEVS